MWTLEAPLSVPQSKKKNFILNLNVYRNAHYQTLNKVKQRYKEAMTEQIKALPKLNQIQIGYRLYPKTRRLCDISNILAIHDKFFCDALQELGKLEDDNYLYLNTVTYSMGEVDKENPRVEIYIWEISDENHS
jgi:Holliday junction resolvase RusA-like endonuclease